MSNNFRLLKNARSLLSSASLECRLYFHIDSDTPRISTSTAGSSPTSSALSALIFFCFRRARTYRNNLACSSSVSSSTMDNCIYNSVTGPRSSPKASSDGARRLTLLRLSIDTRAPRGRLACGRDPPREATWLPSRSRYRCPLVLTGIVTYRLRYAYAYSPLPRSWVRLGELLDGSNVEREGASLWNLACSNYLSLWNTMTPSLKSRKLLDSSHALIRRCRDCVLGTLSSISTNL